MATTWDVLEKDGEGLNLTWEVRRAILCHTGPDRAETLEGRIIRLADKIAYINHDIDDAMRGQIIFPTDIPIHISQVLGFTHSERINTLTTDVIAQSMGKNEIVQSPACGVPRGRRPRPRTCSGGCLSTMSGSRMSCRRSTRTSG